MRLLAWVCSSLIAIGGGGVVDRYWLWCRRHLPAAVCICFSGKYNNYDCNIVAYCSAIVVFVRCWLLSVNHGLLHTLQRKGRWSRPTTQKGKHILVHKRNRKESVC